MTYKITDPTLAYYANHKFLGTFGMVWISLLILLVFTSIKTFTVFGWEYSVGILTYPLTYIFNDIFTEVYGYSSSRRIIWSGFFCLVLVAFFAYLYSMIPPSEFFLEDQAFRTIFQSAPVVVLFTLFAFFAGEVVNSFVLAKLKIYTQGKFQESRYIMSTFFGQIVDCSIFTIGVYIFANFYTKETVVPIIISSVVFCVFVEMAMIPITKRVIKYIKEKEGIDTYDVGTNFNPFKLG